MARYGSVSGADKIAKIFEQKAKTAKVKAEALEISTAKQIQSRAKEIVPVDTHNLQHAIIRDENTVYVDLEEAPYGDEVEFGTFKSPAQPYMRPAIEEVKRDFQKNARKIIK